MNSFDPSLASFESTNICENDCNEVNTEDDESTKMRLLVETLPRDDNFWKSIKVSMDPKIVDKLVTEELDKVDESILSRMDCTNEVNATADSSDKSSTLRMMLEMEDIAFNAPVSSIVSIVVASFVDVEVAAVATITDNPSNIALRIDCCMATCPSVNEQLEDAYPFPHVHVATHVEERIEQVDNFS
jgi:hypothetical protein